MMNDKNERSVLLAMEKLAPLKAKYDSEIHGFIELAASEVNARLSGDAADAAQDALRAAFQAYLADQERKEELESAIKTGVLALGLDVQHAGLLAQYSAGRVNWNSKMLEGLALADPRVAQCRGKGEPFVSIKKDRAK